MFTWIYLFLFILVPALLTALIQSCIQFSSLSISAVFLFFFFNCKLVQLIFQPSTSVHVCVCVFEFMYVYFVCCTYLCAFDINVLYIYFQSYIWSTLKRAPKTCKKRQINVQCSYMDWLKIWCLRQPLFYLSGLKQFIIWFFHAPFFISM